MSVGVGVGGSSSSHSHHPHPFSSFIQPSNPPPLHSPLQPYASPSLFPLPSSQWPASFPHYLFDSYSSLPATAAYPASAASARPFPLPQPFSSDSSPYGGLGVGAGVAGVAASSVFPSSSVASPAAVVSSSSSSSSTAPSFVPSQPQRPSIVQPRPINLSVISSAPQHVPLSSFSSASSSSSPAHSVPSSTSSSSPRTVCRRKPSNVVLKLTVNLMELFNGINDHYYAAKEKKKQEERERRREREQRESDKASSSSRQQQPHGSAATAAHLSSSTSAVPRPPSSPANTFDDRDSNYIVRQQEQLCDGRYIVEQSLGKVSTHTHSLHITTSHRQAGSLMLVCLCVSLYNPCQRVQGSFGRVIQCRDIKAGRSVAVKIIKSKRAFYKQAQVEIRITAIAAGRLRPLQHR